MSYNHSIPYICYQESCDLKQPISAKSLPNEKFAAFKKFLLSENFKNNLLHSKAPKPSQ
jgi:hypothetical protein